MWLVGFQTMVMVLLTSMTTVVSSAGDDQRNHPYQVITSELVHPFLDNLYWKTSDQLAIQYNKYHRSIRHTSSSQEQQQQKKAIWTTGLAGHLVSTFEPSVYKILVESFPNYPNTTALLTENQDKDMNDHQYKTIQVSHRLAVAWKEHVKRKFRPYVMKQLRPSIFKQHPFSQDHSSSLSASSSHSRRGLEKRFLAKLVESAGYNTGVGFVKFLNSVGITSGASEFASALFGMIVALRWVLFIPVAGLVIVAMSEIFRVAFGNHRQHSSSSSSTIMTKDQKTSVIPKTATQVALSGAEERFDSS